MTLFFNGHDASAASVGCIMAHEHAGHSHNYVTKHVHHTDGACSARSLRLSCVAGPLRVVAGAVVLVFIYGGVFPQCRECWASEDPPGGATLRVEGTAEGTGAEAVRAADENGLLAALGLYLERYALNGDLSLFQKLLETPRPYVRSFERLETDIESGVTIVTLRVSLDEDAIRHAAASIVLPHVATQARFLVLIAQRDVGDAQLKVTRAGIVEKSLVRALREAGLADVRGAAAILEEYDEAALVAQLADDGGIRQLLRENAADSAIVGRAYVQSELASEGSNLLEHHAILELRIVGALEGAHTLRAEAKVLSNELERGTETALHDVCDKVRGEVVPLSALTVAESGLGTGVLLVIRGPLDAKGRDAVLDRLKGVPGAGEAEVLRETQDILRVHVSYTGDIAPLYRHLTWDPYQGFRLSAKQVVAREIRLEVIALQDEK